jgi:hypothetical protein
MLALAELPRIDSAIRSERDLRMPLQRMNIVRSAEQFASGGPECEPARESPSTCSHRCHEMAVIRNTI